MKKFEYQKTKIQGYYLVIDGFSSDDKIAEVLNLSLEEYINIITKNGASFIPENLTYRSGYYFDSFEDIIMVIEILEPYLIFATLIK